jgi:hypothetical protein
MQLEDLRLLRGYRPVAPWLREGNSKHFVIEFLAYVACAELKFSDDRPHMPHHDPAPGGAASSRRLKRLLSQGADSEGPAPPSGIGS